jgi:hypothetical protein
MVRFFFFLFCCVINIVRFASRFERAAHEGDAEAMRHLGTCYQKGAGVAKDHKQAAKWCVPYWFKPLSCSYRLCCSGSGKLPRTVMRTGCAISACVTSAETALTRMRSRLWNGLRKQLALVTQLRCALSASTTRMAVMECRRMRSRPFHGAFLDACMCRFHRVACRYQKAAAKDDAPSMTKLGRLLADTIKDFPAAFFWMKKSGNANALLFAFVSVGSVRNCLTAEAGQAGGMFHLSNFYRDGVGCTKDAKLALRWLKKSAKAGCEAAKELRNADLQGTHTSFRNRWCCV